jgi:hypothetical protein
MDEIAGEVLRKNASIGSVERQRTEGTRYIFHGVDEGSSPHRPVEIHFVQHTFKQCSVKILSDDGTTVDGGMAPTVRRAFQAAASAWTARRGEPQK